MSDRAIIPAVPVSAHAPEIARAGLVQALRRPRYEVLPFAGTAERVEEHVPRVIPVTVTASPQRGLEATLALTETLASRGFAVVPHLAARLVREESHLGDILHRLDAAGIRDVFVIGGDGEQPVGDFSDASGLLGAIHRLAQAGAAPAPERLGTAGYPDGHPLIGDAELLAALRAKEPLASYVVTQMCFAADRISAWVSRVRESGVQLPVHVGVSGVVDQRKLLRVVGRIGVGSSARFLRKHRYGLIRLMRPGGYRPDRLLQALAKDLAEPVLGVAGLHIYTFGDVAATERWRRDLLDRLTDGADDDG